MKDYFSGQN